MPTIRPRTIGPTTVKPTTITPRTIAPKTVLPNSNDGEPVSLTIERPETSEPATTGAAAGFAGTSTTTTEGDALSWAGTGIAGLYGAVQVLAAGQSALWERVKCDPKIEVEAVAAIPERFQLKVGLDVPQAVIQFAEVLDSKGKLGSPMYPLTIPYYKWNEKQTRAKRKSLIPGYKKGNRHGIVVLSNNSKSVVNCSTERESDRMIKAIIGLIRADKAEGIQTSNGTRKGQALRGINVRPKIVKYFSQGQKNTRPDWVVYLDE